MEISRNFKWKNPWRFTYWGYWIHKKIIQDGVGTSYNNGDRIYNYLGVAYYNGNRLIRLLYLLYNIMIPYTWPNRVPKSTYDKLKKDYDELLIRYQNSEWERKFFRNQQKRMRFQIVSSRAIMIIWFILILACIFLILCR